MTEPPNKKIKGQEFVDLINECHVLHFRRPDKTEEDVENLQRGMQKIRDTLEHIGSSSDVSLGSTKTSIRMNWGKCFGLLIEHCPQSYLAIKILTEKLNPGGGLL